MATAKKKNTRGKTVKGTAKKTIPSTKERALKKETSLGPVLSVKARPTPEKKVKMMASVAPRKIKKRHLFFRHLGMKKAIYTFVENLSILLGAGMDIVQAFHSLQKETSSRRMKKVIGWMIYDVEEEGKNITDTFAGTRMFTEHMLSLVDLGEQTGQLDETLRVLVIQLEKEAAFRSRIRSSLMYAIMVFTLTLIVGIGSAWFTLPRISQFFQEMNAELPAITRVLIAIGTFLSDYGTYVIPPFFLFILMMFYFLFSFPKTKFIGHTLLFHTPIIKRLILYVEVSRFGFLFGTMLKAGMPVVEALQTLQNTTTFSNYKKFYTYLTNQVDEGHALSTSFTGYKKITKLFPSSARQMIVAAEQSGALAETFLKIGSVYEQKTNALARDLPTLLEPIVLLFVGAGVAFLALGTLLPIYSLSNIL